MSDERTRDITTRLADIFPRDPDSGNYKLMRAAGAVTDDIDQDIREAEQVLSILGDIGPNLHVSQGATVIIEEDEVESYEEVTVEGELIVRGTLRCVAIYDSGTVKTEGGGLISADATTVGIGPLKQMGLLVDTLPETNETVYRYRLRLATQFIKLTSEGTIPDILTAVETLLDLDSQSSISFNEFSAGMELTLPQKAVDETALNTSEILQLIDDNILTVGYNMQGTVSGTFTYITPNDYNNNAHDASKGYDGLDANGDPKDNGGTYAGVI